MSTVLLQYLRKRKVFFYVSKYLFFPFKHVSCILKIFSSLWQRPKFIYILNYSSQRPQEMGTVVILMSRGTEVLMIQVNQEITTFKNVKWPCFQGVAASPKYSQCFVGPTVRMTGSGQPISQPCFWLLCFGRELPAPMWAETCLHSSRIHAHIEVCI